MLVTTPLAQTTVSCTPQALVYAHLLFAGQGSPIFDGSVAGQDPLQIGTSRLQYDADAEQTADAKPHVELNVQFIGPEHGAPSIGISGHVGPQSGRLRDHPLDVHTAA
jgi:hypothetical protein